MKKNRKLIYIIAGIFISIVSLYYAFKGIDLEKSIEIMKNVDIKYVILSGIISNAIIPIRAIRWDCFIPIRKKIKKSSLIASVYIGYMCNNIFPAKLGEVIRAYTLGQKENINKASILASVVTERLFDVITGVIMLSLSVIFIPALPKTVLYGAVILFGISMIGVIVLIFLVSKQVFAFSILEKILRVTPENIAKKILEISKNFVKGIGFKNDKLHISLSIIYTVLYWFGQSVACILMLKAFNIESSFPLAIFVIASTGFGFAIPSAPSGVGPFEWVIIFALTLVGVDKTLAASFAIMYHMMGILPIIVLGLISALFLGVNLKSATKNKANDN